MKIIHFLFSAEKSRNLLQVTEQIIILIDVSGADGEFSCRFINITVLFKHKPQGL